MRQGDGLILLGVLFGMPSLVLLGFVIKYIAAAKAAAAFAVVTVPATKLTAVAATSAATVGGTALALSAAAIASVAIAGLYVSVGLVNMGFAAREAYKSNETVANLVSSRFYNNDGWTINGVLKSMNTFLFAPFIYLGASMGKGIKLAAEYTNSSCIAPANTYSTSEENDVTLLENSSTLQCSNSDRQPSKPSQKTVQGPARSSLAFFPPEKHDTERSIDLHNNTLSL